MTSDMNKSPRNLDHADLASDIVRVPDYNSVEAIVVSDMASYGAKPGTRSESGTTAMAADIDMIRRLAAAFQRNRQA